MKKKYQSSKRRRQNQSSRVPIILLAAGFILILVFAIMALSGDNQINNQDAIPRVSIAQAKEAFDNGEALLLDVRSETAFNTSHAEGAVNIPLEDLETRMSELNPQEWIIPYCT